MPRLGSRPARLLLNVLFGGAGVAFIVLALRRSVRDGWITVVPSWPRLLVAELLVATGLVAAAAGWRALLNPLDRPAAATTAFYVSQLGKYIPGGFWQPAGQFGLTTSSGIPRRRVLAALSVSVVVLVVSGATISAGVAVTASHLPQGARVASVAGLGSTLLLNRRWMSRVLRFSQRFVSWVPAPEELPSQRMILHSFAWNAITLLLSGSSLAILAHDGAAAIFSFAAAWTIGYLAVPIPSGIGIREAVLVGLMGPATASVVAASVAHRIVTMLAELLLGVGSWVRAAVAARAK